VVIEINRENLCISLVKNGRLNNKYVCQIYGVSVDIDKKRDIKGHFTPYEKTPDNSEIRKKRSE
jgi:hypothetical protein